MGFDDYLDNLVFISIDTFLPLIIGVLHLVFHFYVRESDFGNIFDLLESSPLFNFRSIIVVVVKILILYSMSGEEDVTMFLDPILKY